MAGRIFEFRSIQIIEIEKILSNSRETVTVMEMDENSIKKHKLEITLADIIRNGTWLINFFLSIMVTAAYAGIVFAVFFLFSKNSQTFSLPLQHKVFFIFSSVVIFAGLWIFFSIRGGIEKAKREFVIAERGEGIWKIINENKFDNFYRLLLISKKRKSE